MMETEYQMAVQRTHDAYCKTVIRHAANPMTSEEKKLLQAKHRLEEAQARDRVKERKACADCMGRAGSLAEMQPCPAAPAGAAIPLGERTCPTNGRATTACFSRW